MGDKYHRLIVLLVDICPDPLRKLFEQLAQKDASLGSAYTLDAYVKFRQSDVDQLMLKRKLRADQYDLIYPKSGCTDIAQWDITLLATLLLNMFTLSASDRISVENIRSYRNDLQHKPATEQITDNEFNILWSQLTTHALRIAGQVGGAAEVKTLNDRIKEASVQNMPALGNTLQKWFLDCNSEMKYELETIREFTGCCQDILNGATIPAIGPSGEKVKRMKTVDHILKKLQDNFSITMKTELPDDFVPTQEIVDVKAKLRHNHRVIVTGYGSRRYLQIALEAIKSIHTDIDRCVEMTEADDWRHVDPADVDVVLCKFPYGRIEFQKDRVEKMINVYDSMMYTSTQEHEDDAVLDIVIVSELKILQKATDYFNHTILQEDNVVRVYGSEGRNKAGKDTDNSKLLIEYYQKPISNLEILKKVEEKLETKKSLLIVGPRKSGKTSLAVRTASNMKSDCLVISDANDVKYIDWSKISVIILKNFAGKYEYSKVKAMKWYEKFDILQARVEKMKICLIITCEDQMLRQCKQDFGEHQILQNEIALSWDTLVTNSSTTSESGVQNRKEMKPKEEKNISINCDKIGKSRRFTQAGMGAHKTLDLQHMAVVDMCSDGSFLFIAINGSKYLDPHTNLLYELSSNLELLQVHNLKQFVASVCYSQAEGIIVAGGRQISTLAPKGESCKITRKREIDYVCCCIRSKSKHIIAVDNEGHFHVYNGELKQLFVINSGHNFPVFQYNNIYDLVALTDTKVAVLKADAVVYVDFKNAAEPNIATVTFVGVPQAVCASDECMFVLCCNGSTGECSILQICNNTHDIFVISVQSSEYYFYNIFSSVPMCFDNTKSRLVICSKEKIIDEILLQNA